MLEIYTIYYIDVSYFWSTFHPWASCFLPFYLYVLGAGALGVVGVVTRGELIRAVVEKCVGVGSLEKEQ